MTGVAGFAPEQEQPLKRGLFLPPLLQLLLSGGGLLLSLLLALMFFLAGAGGLLQKNSSPDQLLPLFSMGWSALLIGVLLVPSLLLAIRQMRAKDEQQPVKRLFLLASLGLVLCAPLILLGHWLASRGILTWLVLPPIQVLAVGLPILFLIELARRKIPHNAESGWGVFSIGVVLTQPIVLLIEMLLLLVVGVLVLVWASQQPDLLDSFNRLAQRLMDTQMDPQLLEQMLLPYLQQPWVIYLGLAVGAGFIPLLEELLKPLALWMMVGRRFSEAEGFVYGLFAGGTFALLESLGMVASVSETGWSSILIARVGTAILHVTTTALVGWGLGAAWSKHKYLQLGGVYLLSVLLHSLWNTFGLLLGVQPYLATTGFLSVATRIGPIVLVILALGMVLFLIVANLRLRKIVQKQDVHITANGSGLEEPAIKKIEENLEQTDYVGSD